LSCRIAFSSDFKCERVQEGFKKRYNVGGKGVEGIGIRERR
jgi:hypothetical protein